MNSNSKGISLATLLPSIVVAVMIGGVLMWALSGGVTDFLNQFNSTSKDASQKIDNNLKFDPDKGAGTGSGEGKNKQPSDDVKTSKIDYTHVYGTRKNNIYDWVKKQESWDGTYRFAEFGPKTNNDLKFTLGGSYLEAGFSSAYNVEGVSLKKNLGGLNRTISVKNEQNGKNVSSTPQDDKGWVSLPPLSENTEFTVNKNELSRPSLNFTVVELDKKWDWNERNISLSGNPEEKFTSLYPGKNEFNVEVKENKTNAVISENTITIEKPYEYKIYFKNPNINSRKLGQPGDKGAWIYKTKNGLYSNKTKLAFEADDSASIDPKFVAEFPKGESLKLDIRKIEGSGTESANTNNPKIDKTSDKGKITIEGPKRGEVEDTDDVSTDGWGLTRDRSGNGGLEIKKSKFEIELARVDEEGNTEETVIKGKFIFEDYRCIQGTVGTCPH